MATYQKVSRMGPTTTVKPGTPPPQTGPVKTGAQGSVKGAYAASGAASGAAAGAQYGGAAGAVLGGILGSWAGAVKGQKADREADIQAVLKQGLTGDPNDPSTKAAKLEIQVSSELRSRAASDYGVSVLTPDQAAEKLKAEVAAGVRGPGIKTKAYYESMGAFDYISGLNIGQPTVQSGTGQVTVPSNQAGSGIWKDLLNLGANAAQNYLVSQVNKQAAQNAQVQPGVSQNYLPQGTGVLQLPGGVVLTTNGQIGTPVTTNTTSGGGSKQDSDMPAWLWPLLLVLGLFFLGGKNR